jgi:aryl-alcohol dehydrogenase-like predicted oxidoreductase
MKRVSPRWTGSPRWPRSTALLAPLALAYVIDDPAVTGALIAPRSPDQLRLLCSAPEVHLSAGDRARIDAALAP